MANSFLDKPGFIYFWGKLKTWVGNYVKISSSTGKITITIGNNSVDIYSWAQASTKPSYTLDEVSDGTNRTIPTNVSDLNNDSGFITSADVPEGAAASATTPKMDGTAAVGTDNGFARGDHVHPTDTSRVAANTAITGATKTKITYDSKGLVTGGADLAASDIPSITLSKISDVTASASELNIMDGVTASTAELNLLDGVTATTAELNYVDGVTSNIQTQLDNKVGTSSVGAANGVCPLDSNSKIASTYLPSYVDDVVEAYIREGQTALSSTWLATGSASGSAITPEAGVIYVIMNGTDTYPTNSQYRWGGTAYVKLNDGGISAITTGEIDTIVAS